MPLNLTKQNVENVKQQMLKMKNAEKEPANHKEKVSAFKAAV